MRGVSRPPRAEQLSFIPNAPPPPPRAQGPNSYRAASVLIVSPCYACTLVTMGTLAGRHRFFANMCSRILGRFVPFAGRILCPPARAALRAEAKS